MAYPLGDQVQEVVASALAAMNAQAPESGAFPPIAKIEQKGVVPGTAPSIGSLHAGQGEGGFGQGSVGTESAAFGSPFASRSSFP